MDKPQNRFLSVAYQLYTVVNGEKSLEEQTGDCASVFETKASPVASDSKYICRVRICKH